MVSTKKKPRILVIVGPTASGKSDLAVMLAKKLNGEIISADSRQIYRGLDIGTGKITKREMRGAPHYLLDVAPPKKVFSVTQYRKHAESAIQNIVKRGKLPIVCGGTAFYINALVNGIVIPDVKPDLMLRNKLKHMTTVELFALLKKHDPRRARTIDRHNPHRLIRAIEIAHTIGSVPKFVQKSPYNAVWVGIRVENELLRQRIHERLMKRMRNGMVAEAMKLHAGGLSYRRMEELGLEYRYLARYLEGKLSKQEMLKELEAEIVKYAKRQMTWWKGNKYIHWIERNDAGKFDAVEIPEI